MSNKMIIHGVSNIYFVVLEPRDAPRAGSDIYPTDLGGLRRVSRVGGVVSLSNDAQVVAGIPVEEADFAPRSPCPPIPRYSWATSTCGCTACFAAVYALVAAFCTGSTTLVPVL